MVVSKSDSGVFRIAVQCDSCHATGPFVATVKELGFSEFVYAQAVSKVKPLNWKVTRRYGDNHALCADCLGNRNEVQSS